MSDIKMGDVFELPVERLDMVFRPECAFDYERSLSAARAINSYDRLTAENEALREEVERLRERRNDIDNEAFEYAEQVEQLKQERDQLKVQLADIFIAEDVCAAPFKNAMAFHNAEVIERAAEQCFDPQTKAGKAGQRILTKYAYKLRQQAKDNTNG